jgi:hypothetical protein
LPIVFQVRPHGPVRRGFLDWRPIHVQSRGTFAASFRSGLEHAEGPRSPNVVAMLFVDA